MIDVGQLTEGLRDYQRDCLRILCKNYLANKDRRVCVQAPTGSGKSIIIARFVLWLASRGKRSLVVCHQSEILKQNQSKIPPLIHTSVYCAKLGMKDLSGQIVFASRDSLGLDCDELSHHEFECVVIDEAHMVPKSDDSRYQKILDGAKPRYTVGLTATPYRLQGGLIFGEKKPFEKRLFEIPMRLLIERGYLVEPQIPEGELPKPDFTNIKMKNGEYDEKQVGEAYNDELIRECIEKWLALKGESSLIFCSGIAHAERTQSIMDSLGIPSTVITGKTKARGLLIDQMATGETETIINVGVLTTGVDIPRVDTIVLMRKTASASLFVQMVGRGMRPFDGKDQCLVLDFAGNWTDFGGVENPSINVTTAGKNKKDEIAEMLAEVGAEDSSNDGPTKECPNCDERVGASARVCKYCAHLFLNHTSQFDTKNSQPGDDTYVITSILKSGRVMTRTGKPCIVVSYYVQGLKAPIREWLLLEGESWQMQKTRTRQAELAQKPTKIKAQRKGDFWTVKKLIIESQPSSSPSSSTSSTTESKPGVTTTYQSTTNDWDAIEPSLASLAAQTSWDTSEEDF